MFEIWLSLEKFCALSGLTAAEVELRYHNSWRPSESLNSNGKLQREYALSSLPAETQATYAAQIEGAEAGNAKPPMKGELCEELSRGENTRALTRAAYRATKVTLNGKVLRKKGLNEFAERLNIHLGTLGNSARFEFDDLSFFEMRVCRNGEDLGAWCGWGFLELVEVRGNG